MPRFNGHLLIQAKVLIVKVLTVWSLTPNMNIVKLALFGLLVPLYSTKNHMALILQHGLASRTQKHRVQNKELNLKKGQLLFELWRVFKVLYQLDLRSFQIKLLQSLRYNAISV